MTRHQIQNKLAHSHKFGVKFGASDAPVKFDNVDESEFYMTGDITDVKK